MHQVSFFLRSSRYAYNSFGVEVSTHKCNGKEKLKQQRQHAAVRYQELFAVVLPEASITSTSFETTNKHMFPAFFYLCSVFFILFFSFFILACMLKF